MEKKHIIYIALLCTFFYACNSTDVKTVINPDGSCDRIFTEKVDSAFIIGNTSNNPFPVDLDSNWKVEWMYLNNQLQKTWPVKQWDWEATDTIKQITAIAKRHFKTVKDMSENFKFRKNHSWNNLKIEASLDKKFRWFYTYYDFKETYPKLPIQLSVPLEQYLTADEIQFWFAGKQDMLNGLNGMEINEITNQVEEKVSKWMLKNIWKMQYDALINNIHLFPGCPSRERLLVDEDTLFTIVSKMPLSDIYKMNMGDILNKHFKTSAFNRLTNTDDEEIKMITEPEAMQAFQKYQDMSLNYKLVMPGKLLTTNGLANNDTITWKVNAYRMLANNYMLKASSRKLNIIPSIISVIIVCTALVVVFKTKKLYKN